MPDDYWLRVLFQQLDEAYIYEPDLIWAERDAVDRFASIHAGWIARQRRRNGDT